MRPPAAAASSRATGSSSRFRFLALLLAGAVAVHYQQEQIRDAYRQQVLTVANSTARLPSEVDAPAVSRANSSF